MTSSPPSGCADGSKNVVGVAYACAGGFAVGQARQLCAAGWHVCTKATGLSLTACNTLSGFFVADVPASYQGASMNDTCGTGSASLVWYGCGSRMTGVRGGNGCQGFSQWLDCNATSVSCANIIAMRSLDTTGDSATSDGVLCCQ
jgi:hypothetical protein